MITVKTNNVWGFSYDAETNQLKTNPVSGKATSSQDAKGRQIVWSFHMTEEEALEEIEALELIVNEQEI